MMWRYVTLDDETQIACSDLNEDGTISVAVERPVDWGFDSAKCILPAYSWSEVQGFTDSDLKFFDEFLRNNAPFIIELAQRRASDKAVA